MSGERSETTYRFAPHPSAGFILGLRIAAARRADRRRRARAGVAARRRVRRARARDRRGGTGRERRDRSDQRSDARSVDAGRGPVSDGAGPGALPRPGRAGRSRRQRCRQGSLTPSRYSRRTTGRPSWPTSSCWSASSRPTTTRCWGWPRTAAPAPIPQRCGCSAGPLKCCPRRSASSAWRSTAACSPRSRATTHPCGGSPGSSARSLGTRTRSAGISWTPSARTRRWRTRRMSWSPICG